MGIPDREAIKNLPISDKMTRNVETGKLGIDARWEIDIFGRQKAKSRAASNSLQASQADFIFHLGIFERGNRITVYVVKNFTGAIAHNRR